MTGRAERIEDFIAATRGLGRAAEFVAEFPHPFLVREATTTGQLQPEREEKDDRTTLKVDRRKAAAPVGDGFAREDVWIHRVRRRDGHDGAVALGRDAGCDVVLEDPTISLVHATLSAEDGEADDDDDDGRRFFVADAGSSNGTFVDGAPVPRGARRLVDDQASLRFGPHVKLQFFTASGFFQFLDFYRRIKKRGP